MKPIYSKFIFSFLIIIFLCCSQTVKAQCPYGYTPGTTAYDTTIRLGSGIVNTQLKFAKLDPQYGLITCMRFCVTIKGIIDTVEFENYTNAAQTGDYTYIRKDTITGPGIPTFLTSNAVINSPLYPLGPFDGRGNLRAGPDYYTQGPDTVLSRVLCTTVTDATTLFGFYGVSDSVTYNYKVDANLLDVVTGGSAYKFVLSSALVNFRFEYCTCPGLVLPLNIKNFLVTKTADNKAMLSWSGFDDSSVINMPYRYETEVSRNGSSFTPIGNITGNNQADKSYDFLYTNPQQQGGTFYFRIKQLYANGYTRFSDIRQIKLEGSASPKFIIYPNPSQGIVGIKFDNNQGGKMLLQIFNTQGQKVMQKEIMVMGQSYQQVASLQGGSYWLRLTDVATQLSSVNQLFIK